jgi:hypothetical protein
MSDSHQQVFRDEEVRHPRCPECGIAMWLTEVAYLSGNRVKQFLHFECKVCDSKMIIPSSRHEPVD